MKILVDAFGGDNAPEEIVKGAVSALAENKEITLGFTGDKEKTERVLSALSYDKTRVEVIDAPSVITCEEEPTLAIRKKPDSSMVVAFSLLKEDKADALVSAGSSGALLVGSTLKVGRIRGVNRPALCPVLPTLKAGKKVLLLDAGANAVGFLSDDEIAGDDFLSRIRTKGIDPRQIDRGAVLNAADCARFTVYRNARKVSNVLIRPRKLVKKGGFSAILIADQCKNHSSASTSISEASSFRIVSS